MLFGFFFLADGLMNDDELRPSWAAPGDNVYRWTSSEGVMCYVTATVYHLLKKPWRGQKNLGADAKPAAKAALKLCEDVPILDYNPNFQNEAPNPKQVNTKVVLSSNKKQVAIYASDNINISKVTSALLKRSDVSDEVARFSYRTPFPSLR